MVNHPVKQVVDDAYKINIEKKNANITVLTRLVIVMYDSMRYFIVTIRYYNTMRSIK